MRSTARAVLRAQLAALVAEEPVIPTVLAWPDPPAHNATEAQIEMVAFGWEGQPGLALRLGWRCYHTLRSAGSVPGYPDWTCVRQGRVVFVEAKTARGKLSIEQERWRNDLCRVMAAAPGVVDYLILRPQTWDLFCEVMR